MSPYIVGALIAAGSAVLVWGLTTLRERSERQARERERRGTVLRRAMADYLFALDALTIEAANEPAPPRPTRVDRALDHMVERLGLTLALHILLRLLRRMVYGRRETELTDQLARASTELRLIAPPEVDLLMGRVDKLFTRWKPGDAEWAADWRTLRLDVREKFRVLVSATF